MFTIIKEPYTTDNFYTEHQVIRVRDFNEEAYTKFADTFHRFETGPSEYIPIVIDSYGGECYSVLGMIDLMLETEKTVITYVPTKAMSCGLILAAFGTVGFRYAGSSSHLMLHEAGSWAVGKVSSMKNSVEHSEHLNKYIYEKMALHCGLSKSYFLDLIESTKFLDVFMTPQEAADKKLIDKIGIPKIKVERSTKYSLED